MLESGQDLEMIYEKFLEFCTVSLKGENPKFMDLIKTRYEDCSVDFRNSKEMLHLLKKTQINMSRDETRKFVHLKDLLTELKIKASVKRKERRKREYSSDSESKTELKCKLAKLDSAQAVDTTSNIISLLDQECHSVETDDSPQVRRRNYCLISDGKVGEALGIVVATEDDVDSLQLELGSQALCHSETSCALRVQSSNTWLGRRSSGDGFLGSDSEVSRNDTAQVVENVKVKSPQKSVSVLDISISEEGGFIKTIQSYHHIDSPVSRSPDNYLNSQDCGDDETRELSSAKLEPPGLTSPFKNKKFEHQPKKSTSLVNVSESADILVIQPSCRALEFSSDDEEDLKTPALSAVLSRFSNVEEDECSSKEDTCSDKENSSITVQRLSAEKEASVSGDQSKNYSLNLNEASPAAGSPVSWPSMAKPSNGPSHAEMVHQSENQTSQTENGEVTGQAKCDSAALSPASSIDRVPKRIELSVCQTAARPIFSGAHRSNAFQKSSLDSAGPAGSLIDQGACADSFEVPEYSFVDNKQKRRVNKLELLLTSIRDEIEKCQEKELTLDDLEDEQAAYIYEDKLKKKFVAVWNKLCDITGRSVTTGRPTEKTIKFNGTRYREINRRIEKFLNKTKVFPDFHDIKSIVALTSKKCNLNLSPTMVSDISREAFVDVGEMLQTRRHQDFIATFGSRQTDTFQCDVDPYLTDPELRRKLDSNRQVARSNLDQVITKYSNMQYERNDENLDKMETGESEEDSESEEVTGLKERKVTEKERRKLKKESRKKLEDESKALVSAMSVEMDVAEDDEEFCVADSVEAETDKASSVDKEKEVAHSVDEEANSANEDDKETSASPGQALTKKKYNPCIRTLGRSQYLQTPEKFKSLSLTVPARKVSLEGTLVNPKPGIATKSVSSGSSHDLKESVNIICVDDSPIKNYSDSIKPESNSETDSKSEILRPNIKYTARKTMPPSTSLALSDREGSRKIFPYSEWGSNEINTISDEDEDSSSESSSEKDADDDDEDKTVDEDVNEIVMILNTSSESDGDSSSSRGSTPISIVFLSSDEDLDDPQDRADNDKNKDVKPQLVKLENVDEESQRSVEDGMESTISENVAKVSTIAFKKKDHVVSCPSNEVKSLKEIIKKNCVASVKRSFDDFKVNEIKENSKSAQTNTIKPLEIIEVEKFNTSSQPKTVKASGKLYDTEEGNSAVLKNKIATSSEVIILDESFSLNLKEGTVNPTDIIVVEEGVTAGRPSITSSSIAKKEEGNTAQAHKNIAKTSCESVLQEKNTPLRSIFGSSSYEVIDIDEAETPQKQIGTDKCGRHQQTLESQTKQPTLSRGGLPQLNRDELNIKTTTCLPVEVIDSEDSNMSSHDNEPVTLQGIQAEAPPSDERKETEDLLATHKREASETNRLLVQSNSSERGTLLVASSGVTDDQPDVGILPDSSNLRLSVEVIDVDESSSSQKVLSMPTFDVIDVDEAVISPQGRVLLASSGTTHCKDTLKICDSYSGNKKYGEEIGVKAKLVSCQNNPASSGEVVDVEVIAAIPKKDSLKSEQPSGKSVMRVERKETVLSCKEPQSAAVKVCSKKSLLETAEVENNVSTLQSSSAATSVEVMSTKTFVAPEKTVPTILPKVKDVPGKAKVSPPGVNRKLEENTTDKVSASTSHNAKDVKKGISLEKISHFRVNVAVEDSSSDCFIVPDEDLPVMMSDDPAPLQAATGKSLLSESSNRNNNSKENIQSAPIIPDDMTISTSNCISLKPSSALALAVTEEETNQLTEKINASPDQESLAADRTEKRFDSTLSTSEVFKEVKDPSNTSKTVSDIVGTCSLAVPDIISTSEQFFSNSCQTKDNSGIQSFPEDHGGPWKNSLNNNLTGLAKNTGSECLSGQNVHVARHQTQNKTGSQSKDNVSEDGSTDNQVGQSSCQSSKESSLCHTELACRLPADRRSESQTLSSKLETGVAETGNDRHVAHPVSVSSIIQSVGVIPLENVSPSLNCSSVRIEDPSHGCHTAEQITPFTAEQNAPFTAGGKKMECAKDLLPSDNRREKIVILTVDNSAKTVSSTENNSVNTVNLVGILSADAVKVSKDHSAESKNPSEDYSVKTVPTPEDFSAEAISLSENYSIEPDNPSKDNCIENASPSEGHSTETLNPAEDLCIKTVQSGDRASKKNDTSMDVVDESCPTKPQRQELHIDKVVERSQHTETHISEKTLEVCSEKGELVKQSETKDHPLENLVDPDDLMITGEIDSNQSLETDKMAAVAEKIKGYIDAAESVSRGIQCIQELGLSRDSYKEPEHSLIEPAENQPDILVSVFTELEHYQKSDELASVVSMSSDHHSAENYKAEDKKEITDPNTVIENLTSTEMAEEVTEKKEGFSQSCSAVNQNTAMNHTAGLCSPLAVQKNVQRTETKVPSPCEANVSLQSDEIVAAASLEDIESQGSERDVNVQSLDEQVDQSRLAGRKEKDAVGTASGVTVEDCVMGGGTDHLDEESEMVCDPAECLGMKDTEAETSHSSGVMTCDVIESNSGEDKDAEAMTDEDKDIDGARIKDSEIMTCDSKGPGAGADEDPVVMTCDDKDPDTGTDKSREQVLKSDDEDSSIGKAKDANVDGGEVKVPSIVRVEDEVPVVITGDDKDTGVGIENKDPGAGENTDFDVLICEDTRGVPCEKADSDLTTGASKDTDSDVVTGGSKNAGVVLGDNKVSGAVIMEDEESAIISVEERDPNFIASDKEGLLQKDKPPKEVVTSESAEKNKNSDMSKAGSSGNKSKPVPENMSSSSHKDNTGNADADDDAVNEDEDDVETIQSVSFYDIVDNEDNIIVPSCEKLAFEKVPAGRKGDNCEPNQQQPSSLDHDVKSKELETVENLELSKENQENAETATNSQILDHVQTDALSAPPAVEMDAHAVQFIISDVRSEQASLVDEGVTTDTSSSWPVQDDSTDNQEMETNSESSTEKEPIDAIKSFIDSIDWIPTQAPEPAVDDAEDGDYLDEGGYEVAEIEEQGGSGAHQAGIVQSPSEDIQSEPTSKVVDVKIKAAEEAEDTEDLTIVEALSSARGVRCSESSKEDDRKLVDRFLQQLEKSREGMKPSLDKKVEAGSTEKAADAEDTSVAVADSANSAAGTVEEKNVANTLSSEGSDIMSTTSSGTSYINSICHSSVLNLECEEVQTGEEMQTVEEGLSPAPASHSEFEAEIQPRQRTRKRSYTDSISSESANRSKEPKVKYSSSVVVPETIIDLVEETPLPPPPPPPPKKPKVVPPDVLSDIICNALSDFPFVPKSINSKPKSSSQAQTSRNQEQDGDDDVVLIMEEAASTLPVPQQRHWNSNMSVPAGLHRNLAGPSQGQLNRQRPMSSGSPRGLRQPLQPSSSSFQPSPNFGSNYNRSPIRNPTSSYIGNRSPFGKTASSSYLPRLTPRVPIPTIRHSPVNQSPRTMLGPGAVRMPTARAGAFSNSRPRNSSNGMYPSPGLRPPSSQVPGARTRLFSPGASVRSPRPQFPVPRPGFQGPQFQRGGRGQAIPGRGRASQIKNLDGLEIVLGDSDEEGESNDNFGPKIVAVASLSNRGAATSRSKGSQGRVSAVKPDNNQRNQSQKVIEID